LKNITKRRQRGKGGGFQNKRAERREGKKLSKKGGRPGGD